MTRLLDLRRDGIYADGGRIKLIAGQARIAALRALLGEPDSSVTFPAPGSRTGISNSPCRRLNGQPEDGILSSSRWGDLTVFFHDYGTIVGYFYGPRVDGFPEGSYRGVTLGARLSELIANRAVEVSDTPEGTYGFPLRELGQTLGLHGFASGPAGDRTLASLYMGYVCFGLPR